MAEQVWNIGEVITLDLLVTDPSTGLGLTGQSSYITTYVRSGSTGRYWNGSSWQVIPANLALSEVSSSNEPGRYSLLLLTDISLSADKLYVYYKISNPPTVEGSDVEVHLIRDSSVGAVNVYESESVE